MVFIGGGTFNNTTTPYSASIVATNDIITTSGTFRYSSDRRIKNNIVDSDLLDDMTLLNSLTVRRYNYIDYVSRGTDPVRGMIAQELRDAYPQAVKIAGAFLPNIYTVATISQIADGDDEKHVLCIFQNEIESLFDLATELDTSETGKIKIQIIDEHNGRHDEYITEIISNTQIKITCEHIPQFQIDNAKLFVYGSWIDDFHTINVERLIPVTVAGVQYLYGQQQTFNTQLSDIQSDLQSHTDLINTIDEQVGINKENVETLQSTMNEMNEIKHTVSFIVNGADGSVDNEVTGMTITRNDVGTYTIDYTDYGLLNPPAICVFPSIITNGGQTYAGLVNYTSLTSTQCVIKVYKYPDLSGSLNEIDCDMQINITY